MSAGHGSASSCSGAAHQPQRSWVVLNRDSTWEEIVLDETGSEQVVRRCRTLTDEASASYGRVFDASRLRAACKKFADRRVKQEQRMDHVWKSLIEYGDTELVKCHQQSKDSLDRLCQGPIKLFLSGSAAWMKRSLVKALLGFDTDEFPLSDQVMCSYRAKQPESDEEDGSFVGLLHFRQDLTDAEISNPLLFPAIRSHLASHGPSFPYKTKDVADLGAMLGTHANTGKPVEKALDESWDDLNESSVSVVESLEVFLVNSTSALASGLEIVDLPAVQETDVVSTALRRQADVIVFVLNADEPFDWWPVEQALQYLPTESVFVVPVSDGTQDSQVLTEARKRAKELGVLPACIHPLPAVMSRRAIPATFLSHLEGSLAVYLEGHASSRALELSRHASRIAQALARQVGVLAALLECPGKQVRSLQVDWAPKLLELEDNHRRRLVTVKREYDTQVQSIKALVEEHLRRVADLVPELASRVVSSHTEGKSKGNARGGGGLSHLAGAFSAKHKESVCVRVEAALRAAIEGETTRWTVMTLLPTVEKARIAIQQALGDDASAQGSEVDSLLSSVLATADSLRGASQDPSGGKKEWGLAPGLAVSTRVASYIGVANGCRAAVLPVLSGHLLASYALLFVGAIGGVFTSWLALKTVGQDTERQIKEFVGEEVSKALRLQAPQAASSVVAICMQPCMELIDRYKVSFAAELSWLTGAIGQASSLLEEGAGQAEARKHQCLAFSRMLEEAIDQLSTEQFTLIQENHTTLS